jgi:hypothetical protein
VWDRWCRVAWCGVAGGPVVVVRGTGMRRHRSRTRHSLFPPPPPPPQSVTLQSKQFAPTHIHPPPSVRGSTLAIVCQAPHEQSRSSSTQSNQTLLLDTELSCKSEDNYIVRSHRHTLITHSIETYRWGRPGVPPRHHSLIEPSLSLASSHHQQGTTSGQFSGQLPKLEPRLLGELSSRVSSSSTRYCTMLVLPTQDWQPTTTTKQVT